MKILEVLLIIICIIYMWGGLNRFKRLKTIKDYDKKAMQLAGKKKWGDAIRVQQEMLNKFQLDKEKIIELYISIGNSYYEQEQYEQAIAYYNKGVELLNKLKTYTIKNVEPLINILDFCIRCNRYDDAKKIYSQLQYYQYNETELEKLKEFALFNNLKN